MDEASDLMSASLSQSLSALPLPLSLSLPSSSASVAPRPPPPPPPPERRCAGPPACSSPRSSSTSCRGGSDWCTPATPA